MIASSRRSASGPASTVAEFGAVEPAVDDRAGESRRKGAWRVRRGLEGVDGIVRIEGGDAVGGEHFGDGGLAHADPAGKADDDHEAAMVL